MTCNEFRDHVEDLLDGLLPPEEAERFEAHREDCDDCAGQKEEAGRFRSLLAREGRAALGAWEARRLSLAAATQLPGEGAAPVPRRRFAVLRLAAAAAIVAAAAFVGSGLLGEPGPVALADGVPTRLDPGVEATFGHRCRLLVEDRAVSLTLHRAKDEGAADILEMERGVALFRLDSEHALAVQTDQGIARAVGATFVVDVRSDGAVSLDVVTGRVRLERGADVMSARSGERIEVDSKGVAVRVSRARMDELEVVDSRRSEQFDALRAELERVNQLRDELVVAAGTEAEDADGLPFDELGRALHKLSSGGFGWGASRKPDPARNQALALFLVNGERIRKEFGASDHMQALSEPAFVSKVAAGYLGELAPEATEDAMEAAVRAVQGACDRAVAVEATAPLPAERAAARQRALIDIIRAVDTHLGSSAAADVVRAFRGDWDGPRPTVQRLDDRLESRLVGIWKNIADLDDEQVNRVADFVRAYIAETIVVQERVAAALTADEAERILYPRSFWRGFGRGAWQRKGAKDDGDENADASGAGVSADTSADDTSADDTSNDDTSNNDEGSTSGRKPWQRGGSFPKFERPPERSDSEVVAERLRELDARLHLGEPRRRYERALFNLLRPEQREKVFPSNDSEQGRRGFLRSEGFLNTFRAPKSEQD